MKTQRIIFSFAAVLTTLCVTALQSTVLAVDESSGAGKVTTEDNSVAAVESGMLEVRLGGLRSGRG